MLHLPLASAALAAAVLMLSACAQSPPRVEIQRVILQCLWLVKSPSLNVHRCRPSTSRVMRMSTLSSAQRSQRLSGVKGMRGSCVWRLGTASGVTR